MHIAESAVLGMRRLAIIDLGGGQQPIYDETRRIAVVCNGEIYNYLELFGDLEQRGHKLQSRSDICVVPHLYEERGREMMGPCRGMFAGALWDDQRKSLVLFRDRAGKKPLFWARAREGLAFASELPALLALLDAVPPHDEAGFRDYLQLGVVPHPRTIYRGVQALPPGCTLEFRDSKLVIEHYWAVGQPTAFAGSSEEALQRTESGLREAVGLRLRSDVPVGLFLSGGIDSGLVASFAVEAGARDLLAFVVEVQDPVLNEAPAALEVARRFGLATEVVPLHVAPLEMLSVMPTMYGQPFADSSAVPSYLVAKAAARHRKVVLNGDGGDELFAGYRRYQAARIAAHAPSALGPVVAALGSLLARYSGRRSGAGFAARTLRGLGVGDPERYAVWTTDLLDEPTLKRCFPELARATPGLRDLERLRGYRLETCGVRRFMQTDFRLNLADDLLVKMDIATMANSLEARSPFLDIPLAEFAWGLPERLIVHGRRTKPLLRSLAHRRLPGSVAGAPKRGFEVPLGDWLRGPLREVVHDTVLAPGSRVATLGAAAPLRRLVLSGDGFAGNWSGTVWALLMLELFLRAPAPRAGSQ
jgi:asparagine synthase (glutamine-hydrolysing)